MSHIRIKRKSNKGNDVLYKQGGNTRELELNWLPGDLRFHMTMTNEAQRSRSPPSLAAQEEHECKGLTCLLKVSS